MVNVSVLDDRHFRNEHGRLSNNPKDVIPILTDYYTRFFNQENHTKISPFDHTKAPETLEEPINEEEEIAEAIAKLMNGR